MSRKYLVFKLNSEFYATPLSCVREVIGRPTIIPVPQVAAHVLGLINLRGKVISTIDLKKKLNLPEGNGESARASVILIDFGESIIGCLVDSVTEVLRIEDSQVTQLKEEKILPTRQYIVGAAHFDDREMILILDLLKVPDTSDYVKAA